MSEALTLTSFGSGYKALVIGASGAIGQAFCQLLRADAGCSSVRELSRASSPALDLEDPTSIAAAAAALAEEGPYQLILHAAGLLHRPGIAPEKSLAAIEADALRAEAIEWQATRGGRSGRVAWQFFTDLAGRHGIAV